MALKAFLARRVVRRLLVAGLLLGATVALFVVSVVFLDDRISRGLRSRTETLLNAHSERLYRRARGGTLTWLDRGTLHGATLAGVVIGRAEYPEASAILFHYVYGDGSDLELSSAYFNRSPYLCTKVAELGEGSYGPIGFEQRHDWRLSLALNPYYLDVQGEDVRLWHPRIEFAPSSGQPTLTVVPIGKLRARVHDNLISALNPTPFMVYSDWKIAATVDCSNVAKNISDHSCLARSECFPSASGERQGRRDLLPGLVRGSRVLRPDGVARSLAMELRW